MATLAIIGAGIGGCSAAYFASKYIPGIKVTIYESQDRIGGRILTQKEFGTNLEIGAAFFNGGNKTILSIVNAEKLKVKRVDERKHFAVWNGSKIIFRSNKQAAITNLKLLLRYKISIIRALLLLRKAKQQISNLYSQELKAPTEIEELLESSGLKKWYTKSFDELLTERGVHNSFIDEIVTPITRIIYSQNANMGGFAGISSLIGVYGAPIYNFTEGNCSFPAHLTEASHAVVNQGRRVSKIEKTAQGFYKVIAENEETVFDGVIIAAPLDLAGIEFKGVSNYDLVPQRYQTLYTKAMKGVFNTSYFGLSESTEPPAIVLTTKNVAPITLFNIQKIENSESLVTISSTDPINDEIFTSIFKDKGVPVLQHCWKSAYPIFKPVTKLTPTRFDKKLIYLNSIEASVSSMETAAFSALNAVKMISTEFS
jgi:monoamine oxidase